MARFLYTQFSFSSGELNPRLLGRTDIREYFNSGKEVTNFAVTTEGGLNQCTGSYLVDETTGSDPYLFTFLDRRAVAIDGGTLRIKYLLSNPGGGAYFSDFGVVISDTSTLGLSGSWNSFTYGTHIAINKIVILTDKNGTYEPVVIEYNTDTQSYFVKDYSDWAVDKSGLAVGAAQAYPFGPQVPRGFTITVSGTTINTTPSLNAFNADMVGSYIYIPNPAGSGSDHYYKITSFTNANQVEATSIIASIPNGVYQDFRLPVWYTGNFPKIVSFFEERMIFCNNEQNIDTMWLSEVSNIYRMAFRTLYEEDLGDAEAFDIVPATTDVTPILWVIPERYISMGTSSEEYIVDGSEGIFSNSTARVRSVSKYGSHDIGLAIRSQDSTYFVERGGKVIRQMTFSEENGGYTTKNLGVLGPDIESISKMIYDYSNKRIYVQVVNDIYTVSVDPSAGVLGWSRIDNNSSPEVVGLIDYQGFSGILYTESTQAHVLNFYLEGQNKLTSFIGYGKLVVSDVDGDDYGFQIDTQVSASELLCYDEANEQYVELPVNTASGHPTFLNGTKYVTSPDFEVEYAALENWNSARVETTPIQQGSRIGDAQLAFQRIDKAGLRMYKALSNVTIGTSETSLEDTEYEVPYTGVYEVHPDGCPEVEHTVIIENNSIKPVAILGVSVRGTGQEG